jgi:hypothetical protein
MRLSKSNIVVVLAVFVALTPIESNRASRLFAQVRPARDTLDRSVLPIPNAAFQGVANRTLTGSKPDFPRPVTAPDGAPNVLLVLLDDAGFGNPSTFGGPVQTPTFEKLAAQGLRYNHFHVTGLCSPTRAALLSGRNHHAVGFGSIAELPGGWPGYSALWPRNAATIAQVLRNNGYSTGAFGKWHLTPDHQSGQYCSARLLQLV